ncbi:hypothetical protein PS2_044744 [Malus domestica]
MSVFQCIIKFKPVNVIGGGAMHRQSRAIGGGGEGIGGREGKEKSVKALFLMSETLAGAGYGDIVPNTERAKLLTSFFIFFVRWIWCNSGGVFLVSICEGFLKRFGFCGVSEDIFRVVMAIAAPAEDALYLSLVSVTTVGYGEIPVKTASTRVFASIWMCFSTIIFIKCLTYLVVRIMRAFGRN